MCLSAGLLVCGGGRARRNESAERVCAAGKDALIYMHFLGLLQTSVLSLRASSFGLQSWPVATRRSPLASPKPA